MELKTPFTFYEIINKRLCLKSATRLTFGEKNNNRPESAIRQSRVCTLLAKCSHISYGDYGDKCLTFVLCIPLRAVSSVPRSHQGMFDFGATQLVLRILGLFLQEWHQIQTMSIVNKAGASSFKNHFILDLKAIRVAISI